MKEPDSIGDDDLQSMFDELNAIVEENKDVFEGALCELGKPMGRMTVRDALISEDPLSNIMGELSGVTPEQKLFKKAYAGLLEMNSAGVSILWDRFRFDEVDQLAAYLKEIGANRTYKAVRGMRSFIVAGLGDPPNEDDLFELTCSEEFETRSRPYDSQFEAMVEEIEQKLLDYAKAHVAGLEKSSAQE